VDACLLCLLPHTQSNDRAHTRLIYQVLGYCTKYIQANDCLPTTNYTTKLTGSYRIRSTGTYTLKWTGACLLPCQSCMLPHQLSLLCAFNKSVQLHLLALAHEINLCAYACVSFPCVFGFACVCCVCVCCVCVCACVHVDVFVRETKSSKHPA
jgi:hypothetical protein